MANYRGPSAAMPRADRGLVAMDDQGALLTEIRRRLSIGLDELCAIAPASRASAAVVQHWDIDGPGRDALVHYGVPITPGDASGVQLVGDIQEDSNVGVFDEGVSRL